MRDYIEINKEMIPYQFNILLADNWFELYVNYNKTADLFTISLYKDDELICTEPLVFGMPLFQDVYQPEKFPSVVFVPYGANATEITFENLGETVFLTIDDEGDGQEDANGGLAIASTSGGIVNPGGGNAKDELSFTDRTTGETYSLYVSNGKLTMEGDD